MDEIHISCRKLASKTGISFSTLSRIAIEERTIKQSYIDVLCKYFNVTAEFLICHSNKGYKVLVENSNKVLEFTYDEAVQFKNNLEIKEVDILNAGDSIPNKCIQRVVRMNEFTDKIMTIQLIKSKVDSMNYYQLKDTLELIEKYIMKS